MQVFIKRFWGFGKHWPIVSFGQAGSLESLIAKSAPGDLMVFVGTLGDETQPHERGRLLGLAEFGRGRLHSREALPPETFAAAPKGPTGDIKWPHAVVMTRAWKFTDTPLPLMTEVLGRQLPMSAISNAVLLSKAEQESVLALPRVEINVAVTRVIWDEREAIAAAVGPGGTMGPIPTSFTAAVVRDAFKEASTYAFRFGTKNVWKIGWAHDAADRLASLTGMFLPRCSMINVGVVDGRRNGHPQTRHTRWSSGSSTRSTTGKRSGSGCIAPRTDWKTFGAKRGWDDRRQG